MKISQEAMDAAEQLFYLACDGGDKAHLEEVMQSLINSTLERAAGVVEEHWGNSSAAAHKVTVRSIATAIRQLIEE